MNRSEVLVPLGRLREAGLAAESAVSIFDQLHAPAELADAYRALGVVCRESGELATAQAKLRLAVEVAVTSGSALGEAESLRELAVTYARAGRLDSALESLLQGTRGLSRLKPGYDPGDVLAGDYPAPVRGWGEVLRAAHPSTADHVARVAEKAVTLAAALGCGDATQARIRLAAHLHEAGLIAQCAEERGEAVGCQERETREWPLRSAALLEQAGLPWALTPMIRSHRERYNGSGGPEGLRGDAIPVEAQVLGIVDYFDDLTTGGRDRAPLRPTEALTAVAAARLCWRPDVHHAFLHSGIV